MARLARNSALLVAIHLSVAVVAACGGGGGGGAATSQPQQATNPPAGQASQAPAPTDVPAATEAATPAGGTTGGGSAGGVCDLVTADELAGILGVSSVVLTVFPGPPDTCDIQSGDGAPLGATVLVTASGGPMLDAWAASGGQAMPGIGDRAVFVPGSELLLVLVGDSALSVVVFDDGTRSGDERLALMRQIAAIAAGRM
jgi:hypothetical protein